MKKPTAFKYKCLACETEMEGFVLKDEKPHPCIKAELCRRCWNKMED